MKETIRLVAALSVAVISCTSLYYLDGKIANSNKDLINLEYINQESLNQQLSDIRKYDLTANDFELYANEFDVDIEYSPSIDYTVSDNSEIRSSILSKRSKKKQETNEEEVLDTQLSQNNVPDIFLYNSDILSTNTSTSINNSHIKITDQSVYDAFTEEEVYLICRMVETENYGCCFTSKVHCAETVFARLRDGKWGANVTQIITAPNQFVYSRKNISPDTIEAVNYAYQYQTETEHAVMFKIGKQKSWSGYDYILTDPENQSYYGYTFQ